MKYIILVSLFILLLVFVGCDNQPHTATVSHNMNIQPIKYEVSIIEREGMIAINVVADGKIIHLDEAVLRNENTHETISNYGSLETLIYTDLKAGDYTFGARKGNREVVERFTYDR